MFFINPYTFNPSYAGVEGRPAFYLNYRRQWINVDGSPQIGNLSFHMPLKRFVSAGANIVNDRRGLFNTTSVLLSGAYTVVLGDFKSLRFGLSAGGGQSSIDLSKVTDTSDPALAAAGNSFMQGSAGVSFHLKSFHGGITLPSIFEPSYISGTASTLKPLQHVVLHASNRFYWYKNKQNKHLLEPHLIYHYSNILPSHFEVALLYHVNNLVWIGGSHKQRFGSSAFMGLHLNKTLGLGYAYSFKTQAGAELNSPSHELQLTLLLGNKRKDIPFYSFVDTDKEKRIQHHTEHISASQAIAQNRANKTPVKTAPAPPVKKAEPVVKKPTEPVKEPVVVKPEEKKPVVVVKKEPELVKKSLGQMPHVHDTLHPLHTEEKEKIARLEEHAKDPTAQHGQDTDTHPHAERHEFVKKGNHSSELEVADYVIAGVFRSEINASHFADGLKLHGFPAKFGHLTEKNLWYVHLIQTDNLDHARSERDKYRKMLMFRDAWLLTVHH